MTDWSRLAKLAGMLGSPHDGERLNAARLLQAALDRDGVTFGDLSKRIAEGSGGMSPPRIVYVDREVPVVKRVYEHARPNPSSEIAHAILERTRNGRGLPSHEYRFIKSIISRDDMTGGSFTLSTDQANRLTALQETYITPKPKMKMYPRQKPNGPIDESLLDAMGITEKAKDDVDEAVGEFRSRAAGERVQEKPKPKPQPFSAGNAPGATYRGDFKRDPVDDECPF